MMTRAGCSTKHIPSVKLDMNITGLIDSVTHFNIMNATGPHTLLSHMGFKHLNMSGVMTMVSLTSFGDFPYGTMNMNILGGQFELEVA